MQRLLLHELYPSILDYFHANFFGPLNKHCRQKTFNYRILNQRSLSFFSCFRAAYFRITFIIFESVLGEGVCQKVTSVTFVCHKKTLPEVVDNFPNLLTLKLNWFQLEAK